MRGGSVSTDTALLLIPLLPLIGSALSGLLRLQVGRAGAHWITILAMAGSAVLSAWIAWQVFFQDLTRMEYTVSTWMLHDGIHLQIGFLVDSITALRMM